MPRWSRWFAKTAFGFLVVGLVLGGVLLVRRELFGVAPHPLLVSAHVHAIAVGFGAHFVVGVALWLLPRPPRTWTPPRGGEAAAYVLLAGGTVLRVGGEVLRAIATAPAYRAVTVVGGLAQILGMLQVARLLWPRIRTTRVDGGR